ncbi:tetratricopeptide repeat protein [Polaribacter porphyrae]|uniref:Tetratricopeptide repeat protein n=1 Tax=Polaribacter porphyrae TaxID=1137780 RepID=A0A2S7WNS2_9FLAO|nr:tetratricopeptide repeat protein [Polaribacter porphyrae]PQJ78921.1 hypothetical protein BTO18_06890 [Polaribacter porphyrae]
MKKQIITISLGLMSIGLFAQKSELKTVEKALKKNDFSTAISTIKSLDAMEANMEPKYKAKYYFLKGKAYSKSDLKTAADAFNKLFSYEKEIGKSKYTKDAQPMLNQVIQDVSNKAINQYNAKNYKEATENFYLTYKLSPVDTSFLFNAATSAFISKDYETSLKFYKELQDIGYSGITTQYFAVIKDSGKKENVGSLSNQKTYVRLGTHINPTTETTESKQGDIVKNIGYNLINLGKTDEAIVAIQEARKSNPKDIDLLLNEAQLYIKLEKMDKFGELMQEAIKLDPNNPTLFFNLGVVNQNEKKKDEAIKYYKKAIELKPDYTDAYMNLAIAILSEEQSIVEEMNKNLSNFKKYDELEKKQKDLYKEALPYLEKADSLGRSYDTVKSLLNIYDVLEMTEKANALRPVYKKLRNQ